MEKCYLSSITFVSLKSKIIFTLLIITYSVDLLISSFRSVSADDTESTIALFRKVKTSDMLDPRVFDHEHLFDCKPRDVLQSRGIFLDMILTSDFVTNHSGGLKEAGSDIDTHLSYLANTDLVVELDAEMAAFWKGGIFYGHFFDYQWCQTVRRLYWRFASGR